MLDVFKSDAFSFISLTDSVNRLPYVPTRLGSLGLFAASGMTTLTAAIEMRDGVLTLVPSAPRGAPGVNKTVNQRNLRDFRAVHLPQIVHVMADEVQGIRAFGSEDVTETVQARIDEKLAVARLDLDVTHEWQRIGCLKGTVLDADGTTVIYNYFTEFGVTQQVIDMELDVDATKMRRKDSAISRAIEAELGGVMNNGYRVFCGSQFFDAFVDHPSVADTYKNTESAGVLREQLRRGFAFGEGIWEEYRGQIGATPFIAATEAYAVPMGVPGLLKSYFAPANYMETVNTVGRPFYAKPEEMEFGAGLKIQVQSNPLHICTRPRSIIKLTLT